jgi:hypothetical protein
MMTGCAKYIVLCVVAAMSVLSVSGQHYVGIKGGYGAASGRFYPVPDKSGLVLGKYTGGVGWKYYSDKQVVGGVGLELEFQQRGYSIYDADILPGSTGIVSDTTSYRVTTRRVSSVTLPLVWQPHLYMVNRRVRMFASLGVTLSYNTGLGDDITTTDYLWNRNTREQTIESETNPYVMQTARDVRWNYGFVGGFGFGVLMNRWEVFAEGRYYMGLSDILRYKTKYQFNEQGTLRSELDNIFISVGLYYRLGKGGILAPPLRRSRPAPPGDNDFRNIKLNM